MASGPLAADEGALGLIGIPIPVQLALRASQTATLSIGQTTVSGSTSPGGSLVVFGVSQEVRSFITHLVRRDEVATDSDGDGRVTLDLGAPIDPASVFFGIDPESGAIAAGAPAGRPWTEIAVPAVTSPTSLDGVELYDFGQAELLVVRPHVGAWAFQGGDGGELDRHGGHAAPDGVLELGLEHGRPLRGGPPPPVELRAGDVLLVIDPIKLRFAAVRFQSPGWGR